MAKLWTFGDSFTDSFLKKAHSTIPDWRDSYIEWKGYVPKVYGEILSDRLGMELMNYGTGGWDNYSIFESFCNVVDKIEKKDFVIFEWSSSVRFRLTDEDGNWHNFIPKYDNPTILAEYMDRDSINKLLANRANKKYGEEVNAWIKLINNTLKDNNVIHWTPFVGNINATFLKEFELIRDETGGVINDGHFSESGHIELSNVLERKYNRIKNKEII